MGHLHGFGDCYDDGPLLGGQYVIYTLPASANGYDITNVMTAGGWNDGGRDQQAYTVNYATAANPTYFTPLAVVNYNPTNPVGYSMSRATLTRCERSVGRNVVALEFDMTTPGGENGFSGYSEIAAYGSPSATPPPPGPVISVEHQEDTDELYAGNTQPDCQSTAQQLRAGCLHRGGMQCHQPDYGVSLASATNSVQVAVMTAMRCHGLSSVPPMAGI